MFKDKVCVITGASSGLGKALALSFAKQQAKLVLFARNQSALQSIAVDCQQLGSECIFVVGDVTQPDDCAQLIQQTIKQFHKIDFLLNNAGLSMWANFSSIQDLSFFEKLMATNYLGAVYCTHYALPYLCQSQGMIVVISSIQGLFPVPLHTGYAAAKHALHGFFNSLRIELAQSGVDILIVAPSWLRGTLLRANALVSDQDQKFRHHYSESGITLAQCCTEIFTAIKRRRRELLLPKKAILLKWIYAFFPKLVDWYIARRIQQET